jgi:hypothetical protein
MLVPTNDGFFAINGMKGPRQRHHTIRLKGPAYDAGTEFNDEDCTHIPDGGGCAGEGFNVDRTDAEGFVHTHRGMHGSESLDAAVYDWRNPVVKVSIRRIRY